MARVKNSGHATYRYDRKGFGSGHTCKIHPASISERLHQSYLASHCYGAMTVIYPNISRSSAAYFITEKCCHRVQ